MPRASAPGRKTGRAAARRAARRPARDRRRVDGVLDPEELFHVIAQKLRRIVDYRILDIFLPDAEGFLAPAHVEGYDLELSPRASGCALARGSSATAAAAREPVFVPDVSKDPRYIAFFPGVVAELAIPLLEQGPPGRRAEHRGPRGRALHPGGAHGAAGAGRAPRGGDRERDALPRDALVRGAARDALRDREGDGLDPRPRRAAAAAGRDRQAGDRLRDVRHPAARRGAGRARAAQGGQLRARQGEEPARGQRGPVRRGGAQPRAGARRRRAEGPALRQPGARDALRARRARSCTRTG